MVFSVVFEDLSNEASTDQTPVDLTKLLTVHKEIGDNQVSNIISIDQNDTIPSCDADKFWDPRLHMCATCDLVCNPHVAEMRAECDLHCPDFLRPANGTFLVSHLSNFTDHLSTIQVWNIILGLLLTALLLLMIVLLLMLIRIFKRTSLERHTISTMEQKMISSKATRRPRNHGKEVLVHNLHINICPSCCYKTKHRKRKPSIRGADKPRFSLQESGQTNSESSSKSLLGVLTANTNYKEETEISTIIDPIAESHDTNQELQTLTSNIWSNTGGLYVDAEQSDAKLSEPKSCTEPSVNMTPMLSQGDSFCGKEPIHVDVESPRDSQSIQNSDRISIHASSSRDIFTDGKQQHTVDSDSSSISLERTADDSSTRVKESGYSSQSTDSDDLRNSTQPLGEIQEPLMDLNIDQHSYDRTDDECTNEIALFSDGQIGCDDDDDEDQHQSHDQAQGHSHTEEMEDGDSSMWRKIMNLYSAVEAQLHRFKWIIGCKVSSDQLEVVINTDESTQGVDESRADRELRGIISEDLWQFLRVTAEGASLVLCCTSYGAGCHIHGLRTDGQPNNSATVTLIGHINSQSYALSVKHFLEDDDSKCIVDCALSKLNGNAVKGSLYKSSCNFNVSQKEIRKITTKVYDFAFFKLDQAVPQTNGRNFVIENEEKTLNVSVQLSEMKMIEVMRQKVLIFSGDHTFKGRVKHIHQVIKGQESNNLIINLLEIVSSDRNVPLNIMPGHSGSLVTFYPQGQSNTVKAIAYVLGHKPNDQSVAVAAPIWDVFGGDTMLKQLMFNDIDFDEVDSGFPASLMSSQLEPGN